jgi:hypothetical protein
MLVDKCQPQGDARARFGSLIASAVRDYLQHFSMIHHEWEMASLPIMLFALHSIRRWVTDVD